MCVSCFVLYIKYIHFVLNKGFLCFVQPIDNWRYLCLKSMDWSLVLRVLFSRLKFAKKEGQRD